MKNTKAQAVTWKKGYIATGVLAVVLILLAVMPLGVSAAYDYDHQEIGAFEQSEFASFDAEAAFEPMSIDAFGDVGITPFSDNRVTWQPQSPVITVPTGQNYVDIYFTLYRPGEVATPMGIAPTSLVLMFPNGVFNPPHTRGMSFVQPSPYWCMCCFSPPYPPHFQGSVVPTLPNVTPDGTMIWSGTVSQMFFRQGDNIWDYYGEIVVRVRINIPAASPFNTVGYQDITVRRGAFTAGDGTHFTSGYSTVRIAREVPLSFENLPARGLTHVGQSVEQNNNLLLSAPGTAQAAAGSEVILNAGTVEDYQFLGWIRGSLLPPLGANLTQWAAANNVTVRGANGRFNMPNEATTYTAVWGNHGIVGGSAYHIAFHIYTGNQGLIDRFGGYGTPNADGILVINVPVTPGTPHTEWPNQNLLNAALNIDHVLGVSNTPGHAFWGWFRGETLDNSRRTGELASAIRPNPTNPGLRRPALSDRCEWTKGDGIDAGPQYRIFDLLQNPSITQTQKDDLFVNGTLDLFAIWSLWGDVDDNDIVDMADFGRLQTYLLLRDDIPNIVALNRRAGDVLFTGILDMSDFNRLQDYLLTKENFPGLVVLGVRPPGALM